VAEWLSLDKLGMTMWEAEKLKAQLPKRATPAPLSSRA